MFQDSGNLELETQFTCPLELLFLVLQELFLLAGQTTLDFIDVLGRGQVVGNDYGFVLSKEMVVVNLATIALRSGLSLRTIIAA